MSEGSETAGYPLVRKLLHWLTVLIVAAMLASGLTMTRLGWKPDVAEITDQLYFWHKWLGFTFLFVIALRVFMRWAWQAPPIPAHVSTAERRTASVVHLTLYALLIVTPLLGWAAVSAGGQQPTPPLFGVLEMPSLLSKMSDETRDLLFDLHFISAMALAGFAALHILAALSHLIRADGVFRRMWF